MPIGRHLARRVERAPEPLPQRRASGSPSPTSSAGCPSAEGIPLRGAPVAGSHLRRLRRRAGRSLFPRPRSRGSVTIPTPKRHPPSTKGFSALRRGTGCPTP